MVTDKTTPNEPLGSKHLVNEAIKHGAVPDGYREVDILFFQFKKPGDSITGKLILKDRLELKTKQSVGKYTLLDTETGNRYSFLGSIHLDELMSAVYVGQHIMVVYTNDEVLESNFTMKRFKVYTRTAAA